MYNKIAKGQWTFEEGNDKRLNSVRRFNSVLSVFWHLTEFFFTSTSFRSALSDSHTVVPRVYVCMRFHRSVVWGIAVTTREKIQALGVYGLEAGLPPSPAI